MQSILGEVHRVHQEALAKADETAQGLGGRLSKVEDELKLLREGVLAEAGALRGQLLAERQRVADAESRAARSEGPELPVWGARVPVLWLVVMASLLVAMGVRLPTLIDWIRGRDAPVPPTVEAGQGE